MGRIPKNPKSQPKYIQKTQIFGANIQIFVKNPFY